eukprot:445484_1
MQCPSLKSQFPHEYHALRFICIIITLAMVILWSTQHMISTNMHSNKARQSDDIDFWMDSQNRDIMIGVLDITVCESYECVHLQQHTHAISTGGAHKTSVAEWCTDEQSSNRSILDHNIAMRRICDKALLRQYNHHNLQNMMHQIQQLRLTATNIP